MIYYSEILFDNSKSLFYSVFALLHNCFCHYPIQSCIYSFLFHYVCKIKCHGSTSPKTWKLNMYGTLIVGIHSVIILNPFCVLMATACH